MAEPVLLHSDERIAVVDKPSGMLVHPGWARDGVLAVDWVAARLGRPALPVHRLDRGTSGVLLFALDTAAARQLAGRFECGDVDKRYLALVRGVPPESGIVDHPIPRSEDGPRVPAVSEFRRVATCGRFSLVEVRPRTGRLHQVRRHMKHLGHPVIGDANYGRGDLNRELRAAVGLDRLALHAASLAFAHPADGRAVRFDAPLPVDLAEPFARLGLVSLSRAPASSRG